VSGLFRTIHGKALRSKIGPHEGGFLKLAATSGVCSVRLTLSAKEADLKTVLLTLADSVNCYIEVPIFLIEKTTIKT
jgi:hypothetical protein